MAPQPVPRPPEHEEPEDDDLLDADEAAEEIVDEDPDHPMEDDDDEDAGRQEEEIELQNDSAAHFDGHTDSIFCISQHPTNPTIVLTGGGDDVAFIFDTSIPATPAKQQGERESIKPLQKLEGHTDSVNAVAFTLPKGEYAVTAGLDGKLRAWRSSDPSASKEWKFLTETAEVEEINWVSPSPHKEQENIIALGANDGSVWVYKIDAADKSNPLTIVQALYLHTASCTAGTWTPDGNYLATVSEDGSLYVWDVFGTGQAVVSQTPADQRFEIEGGLYSVACTSSLVAVGGAGGNIKVVGLPQPSDPSSKAKSKAGAKSQSVTSSSSAGQILASLQAQSDGIETLSFSSPPLTILAAGSVDGSIALFDTAHRFALRRHIKEAHEEFAVVKVEFLRPTSQKSGGGAGWILTSAGMDGVVRRWDVRGGTTAAGQGFLMELRGHRGEGEGGGVLGFVQGGNGERIVTAGDDGVSLVFRADVA